MRCAAAVLVLCAGAAQADPPRLELRADVAAETSWLTSLGSTASKTIEVTRVAAGYTLGDRFEAGAAYELAAHPFEPGGIASAYGTWRALHAGRLDVAASLSAAIDIDADRLSDPRPRVALTAGAGIAYRITPCVAVFSGTPWGPAAAGEQLRIAFGGGGFSTFEVPFGVMTGGFHRLDAYAMTTAVSVLLSAPRNGRRFAWLGRSTERGGLGVPVALGARYAVLPALKVGFEVEVRDLEELRSFTSFAVTAAYRGF